HNLTLILLQASFTFHSTGILYFSKSLSAATDLLKMSHELIRPYYYEFEKMQSTLNLFTNSIPPEERLTTFSAAFDKILHLWDAPDQTKHISTTKRNKSSKTFLLSLFDIGHEAFFLCALSISITQIGNLKKKELFLKAIQVWIKEKADEIPTSFKSFSFQLYETHKSFFEEKLKEQRQERSSSNLDNISEPEMLSDHIFSRHSTVTEDISLQDNTSASLLGQGDLSQNISTPRRSIEDLRPVELNNQNVETSSFKKSVLRILEHAEICSVSRQAIFALAGDNISGPIHLAFPADSNTDPFLIIPIKHTASIDLFKLNASHMHTSPKSRLTYFFLALLNKLSLSDICGHKRYDV
ncbi:hypothetical protein N5P37_011449, partial [Trichoderma harzianum]